MVPSRARAWLAPLSLLGVALAALIALAIVEAVVEPPGGGCFGQPSWASWVSYGLAPLSVLAASASGALFGLRFSWSMLMSAAVAFSIAVSWLVVLVLTLIAVEGPC
jgi:hypothetical protein